MVNLYNGDCLEVMNELIKDNIKIDAIITDPPYGTVKSISNIDHGMSNKCKWDIVIKTESIMDLANKLLRQNGKLLLFAQQPFTTELINKAIINLPFCYNMIWIKDHFANSLTAKKAPLNYYEDIVVFSKKYDIECENPLRLYFKQIMNFINLSKSDIVMEIGQQVDHVLRPNSSQFCLCTKQTYSELIKKFKINEMKQFKSFYELEQINIKFSPTFNLWEKQKYKSNVLKYKKDYNGFHPTQKPIKLMEDLIKTYTNENEIVLGFTMDSWLV